MILVNDLHGALTFLNDKPPFKLLLRKHNKPMTQEEIENCINVAKRDLNLRIMVFQNQHKDIVALLNLSSVGYLQDVKNMFKNIKIKTILKGLAGQ